MPAVARAPRIASPSAFHAGVHRLQLELFQRNQRLINEAVEGYTDDFRRYEARYRRAVRRVRGPIAFDELLERTWRARVALVGDYHTLPQAQRMFYRLLRAQPADKPLVIALEMLPSSEAAAIDAFIAGDISEEIFVRRVDLKKRWPFARESMRPIFDLCRARKWRVIGIDCKNPGTTPLRERDAFAARAISAALSADRGAHALVLIGEMHLAPSHLPRALEKVLDPEDEILRVHQNPERIWFEQNELGVTNEHDVLELDDGAIAVLSASPLVCQQSFLTWLEQAREGHVDAPLLDGEAQERGFHQAIDIIGRAFELPLDEAVRDVEVVGPSDLGFFARLKQSRLFSTKELRQIRAHVLSSESCYIPRARLVYLATLSINHAAEEAAHYLRHHLSGEALDRPQPSVDAFYSRVLSEAVGFLGSRIVNPKRKCARLTELEQVAGGDDLDGIAALLSIEHKRMERGERVPGLSRIFESSPEVFNAVTHLLGYMLGDQIYYALVRGNIRPNQARELFLRPFDGRSVALLVYLEWIARVGDVLPPDRA